MTRFSLMIAVCLVASPISISPAQVLTASVGWSMSYSDSEELHKLIYGGYRTEGDAYFRCKAGSGWIFFIHDYVPKVGNPPFQMSVGELPFLPSWRTQYDDVDNKFYVDAAIPANHRVLVKLARGQTLRVEGLSYPIKTEKERRAIESFVKVCDGDG